MNGVNERAALTSWWTETEGERSADSKQDKWGCIEGWYYLHAVKQRKREEKSASSEWVEHGGAALTNWQAETEGERGQQVKWIRGSTHILASTERGQQAANITNEEWHSHPGDWWQRKKGQQAENETKKNWRVTLTPWQTETVRKRLTSRKWDEGAILTSWLGDIEQERSADTKWDKQEGHTHTLASRDGGTERSADNIQDKKQWHSQAGKIRQEKRSAGRKWDKWGVALTSWWVETEEREVSRQQTRLTMEGTHILASRDRGRKRLADSKQDKQGGGTYILASKEGGRCQ